MAKKRRKSGAKSKSNSFQSSDALFYLKWGSIAIAAIGIFLIFYVFLFPNSKVRSERYHFEVSPNSNIEKVAKDLYNQGIIKSKWSFLLACKAIDFHPRKGFFIIDRGWNNIQFIYHLNNDKSQYYYTISIPAIRSRKKIVNSIAQQSQKPVDSIQMYLRNGVFLKELGDFNEESIYCIFLPGKHPVVSNSSTEEVLKSLHAEYVHFWNDERLSKSKKIGYSPNDATVLASIVYSETKARQEMPVIAGLYINRINNNMKLESDPTVVFANSSFNIQRVYNKHKRINSKYNTYKYKGLPPGPICAVPGEVIDAVLNYEEHDYLYFCAKGDGSGCHNFAVDFEEHRRNATGYQKQLDSMGIK